MFAGRVAALAVVFLLVSFSAEAKPKRKPAEWMRVAATAYCNHGITDSGARTRRGGVAADPRLIPLGSTIRVEGLQGAPDGIYTVLDTGRTIKGREIDVFMPRCAAAKTFGRQHVRVKILKPPPAQTSRSSSP
jgi:3D (Asp-Asp-Asp) domain-containing protein